MHNHAIPGFYQEAVYKAGTGPAIGTYPDWSETRALDVLAEHQIDIALLSIAQPGVGFLRGHQAAALARRCNEFVAELCRCHPGRFGSFLLVPMDDAGHAIAEIEYGFDTLGADGVCLFASYGEKFLGDAHFDPVLELLHDRSAAVFVHPTYHPSSRALDLPWPGFMVEYVFDTTRAAVNLMFSGALERFPGISFILAHGGGTLPYVAWRLAASPRIDARLPALSEEQIMAGLATFYYDTALSMGPQTWGALSSVADPSRVLFGSDWPFAPADVVGDGIRRGCGAGGIPAEQEEEVMSANAATLFPRLAELRSER